MNVTWPSMEVLVAPEATVERLATGFRFTEGPIWNQDGRFLLFSDMPGDVRRRWSEADGVDEVRRPSNKCNGMVYNSSGRAARLRARDLTPRPRASGRHA